MLNNLSNQLQKISSDTKLVFVLVTKEIRFMFEAKVYGEHVPL